MLVCLQHASAEIDENNNQLSDVWEAANVIGLSATDDLDGDSFNNRQEAAAGTDPLSGANFPRISSITRPQADRIVKRWPTVAGIHYQTMFSKDLVQWQPTGPMMVGNGEEMEQVLDLATSYQTGGADYSQWFYPSDGLATVKAYAAAGTPAPAIRSRVVLLEFPQSSPNVENFGRWVRGWIIPPATGAYRFWIASDDSSELWISTNKLPANKQLRASVTGHTNWQEWTKYPSQKSALINLTAGQSYYFEAFQHEGVIGDHLAVRWTKPGMAENVRESIPASALAFFGDSLGDLMSGTQRYFFRNSVVQGDSDGDGVSDYEERLLGLDPENPTTTPRMNDGVAARQVLGSASSLTLGVVKSRAYEEGTGTAQFVVFRSGGIRPLTATYTISGNASSGVDFQALSGQVIFPAGARAVAITVTPLQDGIIESQENVTLTLQSGAGYTLGSPVDATVTIDDAADVLYLAQLRSAPGLGSSGSGTAAVRRTGNSLSSKVSLSFGGLGSPQSAAEIYYSSNGQSGPTVFTYPLNQAQGLDWNFLPAGGLTREQILTALGAGELWVRVVSQSAGAEIIGRLMPTPGWQSMPAVLPPPSAAPVLAANQSEAARFLTQATYGPKDAEITSLVGGSFAQWIDNQIALPPSYHRAPVMARAQQWISRGNSDGGWQGPRNETWWQMALTAPDQLRQRMAFALSQIFVISQFGALDIQHEGVTIYYDMLLEKAFGNYRDLLEEVTLSPMMGTYLSMIRNRKPDPLTGHEPDENYAREVMQLFSVGLSEMHPDGSLRIDADGLPVPTYNQEDTVGLAHIFTGWGPHYNPASPPLWNTGGVADRNGWFLYGYDPLRRMSFNENYHDTKERQILNGNVIAASGNGVDRMRQALDAISNHPNVGPFMARQLIQRFVTSNPSPGYIHRVAGVFNNDGSGVRGNLGATLKAVLLDYEARHATPRQSLTYGKPAEPVLRLSRALRVLPGNLPKAAQGDPSYYINMQYEFPEQAPLLSSSVFNFFQPGFSNPGPIARAGLLSPEFQIFAETNGLRQANFNLSAITWGIWTPEKPTPQSDNLKFTYNFDSLVAILNTAGLTPLQAQERLVDHLNVRFLFGAMSPQLRSQILGTYGSLPGGFGFSFGNQVSRVQTALYLVLNSPEYFVQK